MGIYQLLSPVLALSFSLTAAGYQTAISKFVAEHTAKQKRPSYLPVMVGLSISLPLSLICTAIVFAFADFIGTSLLLEPRTVSLLRILAFSIPLSAVHSCINGYFYGMKKTVTPAMAQLLEQLTRVGCVFLIASRTLSKGAQVSINVAVLGLTVGEFISMLLTIVSIYACYARDYKQAPSLPQSAAQMYHNILHLALPLTANRIVLNLLQSVESVSIPAKLKEYGYDTATALSVYGVLTGMAMPLIFFPNALTGSISVLLLPMISESYALKDMSAVKRAILRTVKYCGILGVLCMAVFGFLGRFLGVWLFDSPLAGHFITTLGFICPFIYLDTILSSILQGLGMAGRLFLMNAVCLLIRLAFVFWTVPTFGITGYLWGLLVSQLVLCVLYLLCLYFFADKEKYRG